MLDRLLIYQTIETDKTKHENRLKVFYQKYLTFFLTVSQCFLPAAVQQ